MKKLLALLTLVAATLPVAAASMADPLAPFPGKRMSFGVGYHLDGMTITSRDLPAVMNRIGGRIAFAPVQYINIGADLGVAQMEVASDSAIDLDAFHGDYSFSWGASLKLNTPLLKDVVGLTGIARGTHFKTEGKNAGGAYYEGFDLAGTAGFLFHIRGFGYAAIGSRLYLIDGTSHSFDGSEGNFSNSNNLQGWVALEWFPKTKSGSIPYISVAATGGPKINFGGRAPVNEFSFSVTVGAVTKRLWGEVSELEWHP